MHVPASGPTSAHIHSLFFFRPALRCQAIPLVVPIARNICLAHCAGRHYERTEWTRTAAARQRNEPVSHALAASASLLAGCGSTLFVILQLLLLARVCSSAYQCQC